MSDVEGWEQNHCEILAPSFFSLFFSLRPYVFTEHGVVMAANVRLKADGCWLRANNKQRAHSI